VNIAKGKEKVMEQNNNLITYEYGAMSSKFSCQATNKLTAYVTMCVHFQSNAHLIAIYAPEECLQDSWLSITGEVIERLDEIFGGTHSFDEYVKTHEKEIVDCYKTIKRIV
jgi:hypothetical protein